MIQLKQLQKTGTICRLHTTAAIRQRAIEFQRRDALQKQKERDFSFCLMVIGESIRVWVLADCYPMRTSQ